MRNAKNLSSMRIKMKKYLLILFLFFISNAYSASPIIDTCRAIASSARQTAIMKKQGATEENIREGIFEKNTNLKKQKNPYVPESFIDSVTEQEIEDLIFVFSAKNRALNPDQVYSIRFDDCYKGLKSKGY